LVLLLVLGRALLPTINGQSRRLAGAHVVHRNCRSEAGYKARISAVDEQETRGASSDVAPSYYIPESCDSATLRLSPARKWHLVIGFAMPTANYGKRPFLGFEFQGFPFPSEGRVMADENEKHLCIVHACLPK
jgi:hypothetical protein